MSLFGTFMKTFILKIILIVTQLHPQQEQFYIFRARNQTPGLETDGFSLETRFLRQNQ